MIRNTKSTKIVGGVLSMVLATCGTGPENNPARNDGEPCDPPNECTEGLTCSSDKCVPLTTTDTDTDPHSDTDADADVTVRHLSSGRPVYTSAGEAIKCNDGEYGVDYWGIGTEEDNTWTTTSTGWCAIDLGDISATQVLVALSDEKGTADIEGSPGFKNYVIATSADSTNGNDGTWSEEISVTGNAYGYREHRLSFLGQRWIKVAVQSPSTVILDEFDVWDVSNEPDEMSDSIIWVGDSITARCSDRHGTYGANPSMQKIIQKKYMPHYPLQIGAGTVGISAAGMIKGTPSKIDTYLDMYPDVRFWGVLLGTNDSAGSVASEDFHANLTSIVDKIEAEGHQAIIAKIPYTDSKVHGLATERLNTVIDEVTEQKELTPGPDLYNLFKRNADTYYGEGDDVHPNSMGCTAWQQAWAEVIGPLLN